MVEGSKAEEKSIIDFIEIETLSNWLYDFNSMTFYPKMFAKAEELIRQAEAIENRL
jgi:hypothetical protein